MKKIAILLVVLFNSACTTTMYVAKSDMDMGDKRCGVQTYWYKTSHLFGSKADQALTVSMGGRRPVTYKKESMGIVYIGDKKSDTMVIGVAPVEDRFVCGQLQGVKDLLQFTGDSLRLTMHCTAKQSALSLTPGYLPARELPYELMVSQQKEFSWLGGLPEAPPPPGCVP